MDTVKADTIFLNDNGLGLSISPQLVSVSYDSPNHRVRLYGHPIECVLHAGDSADDVALYIGSNGYAIVSPSIADTLADYGVADFRDQPKRPEYSELQ